MWDAIEELEPNVEEDSYQGDMLLVFLDEASRCDTKLMGLLEKRFAAAPGGRDLRFAFALSETHAAHHEHFGITELPALVFIRNDEELDRCSSAEDVIDMGTEVIERYFS